MAHLSKNTNFGENNSFYEKKLSCFLSVKNWFADIFYTANILITMCLSHERYAITEDSLSDLTLRMASKRFRYCRLMKYMLFVIPLSLACNLPRFFTHEISETGIDILHTSLRQDQAFITYYNALEYPILISVSFLAILSP